MLFVRPENLKLLIHLRNMFDKSVGNIFIKVRSRISTKGFLSRITDVNEILLAFVVVHIYIYIYIYIYIHIVFSFSLANNTKSKILKNQSVLKNQS